MALFGQFRKQKESSANLAGDKAKKVTEAVKKPAAKQVAVKEDSSKSEMPKIIVSGQTKHDIFPRVTEKGTFLAEKGVYIFNIGKGVSKGAVKDAVAALFKVHPRKVAIVNIPSKKMIYKGKYGVSSGQKKAYIYLKEGDKIDIV